MDFYFSERERRHFVTLHNSETSQSEKPRARRYIPHGYGGDEEFRPHPQYIKPKYTEYVSENPLHLTV